MPQTLRRFLIPAVAGFLALNLATAGASADELLGKVKSVDAAAKKIVVTERSTDKDTEVSIDAGTSWVKEKKGKASKKFDLAKLKVGSTVEVTRAGSFATKVLIKEGKKKKSTATAN